MKRALSLGSVLALSLSLAACQTADIGQSSSSSSASSSVQPRMAMAEGMLQKAGVGIFMEGTHHLVTETNEELLLKSGTLNLDLYVDEKVRVSGEVSATVEAGGMIMDVESIETMSDADLPEVLEESSSSIISVASSSRPLPEYSSSARSLVSSVSVAKSSLAPSASSVAVASSSTAIPTASSSAGIGSDRGASVTAMAKAQVDATNFRFQYCNDHIGFCIPYHRNWYFQSSGANISPYLWHVEFADLAIEEAGQGIIVLNLVSGSLEGSDGVAVDQGDFVVASHQWTANRHFEVTGPKELRAAVEFMAKGIEVYAQQ